jgi:chorismate synthase
MEKGKVAARTNNAGGITGGISTGGEIVIRAAFRPPASISLPQESVNASGEPVTVEVRGRHDPCIVPRAIPVLEAMTALVIADSLLVQDSRGR